jgi:hypothetical protein
LNAKAELFFQKLKAVLPLNHRFSYRV